jgi:uncharacterized OB-fold protein
LIEEDDEGRMRLVGARCASCTRRSFPAASTCPWCGSSDTRQVALARTGTLWAWTAVTAAPPGYDGEVPFGFGVVQLDDDEIRVVTRLTESDPGVLEFGQPMALVTVDVSGGDGEHAVMWAFEPQESA